MLLFLLSVCIGSNLFSQVTEDEDEKDEQYTIAFLLPFNASKVFIRDLQQSDFFLPNETQIAVEFYQGAMLAIDSLKKMGLKATVLVYDAGNDSATINAILKKEPLEDADLIIGPLAGYALKATSSFCFNEHIPLISPLSAAYVSSSPNEFFILANATMRTHCEAVYDYLLKRELTHHLVMVYRKNAQDQELVKYIKDYRAKKTYMSSPELKFAELSDSSKMRLSNFRDSLFITDKNIVLVPSNDEMFVRSLLQKVASLSADYNIEVIGMPTWSNFDLVPSEYFDSAKVMITSSFWLDKTSEKAAGFKSQYVSAYQTNPTEYSVRGYDELFYFGSHLMQMGDKFLTVFPRTAGLTASTAYDVVPVLRQERDVMYRENKSIFFLQHQNGKWMKLKTY
ncbi:MAG TPA: ABC transporter substrate-binding protein [Chitinophagales bacterium]|nr:ABC transporter substrate-binding protein [Chitinophagales bacterium]